MARSDVRERQDTLQTAQRARLSPADLRAQIAFVRAQHREVGKRIIQARRVLVREVVDVFGVQRRKGWEIAGIELPAPENFRCAFPPLFHGQHTADRTVHPSMSINAAFMHTIHLLALLTRYLSIEVPFEPTPQAPLELVHVGRPAMKANVPFLSTSKWREKHVLWMSSTASLAGQLKKTSNSAARQAAVAGILAKSYKKHRASLTAFALLAHSVAYLAYTQGVPGIGLRDDGSRGDSEDEDENMGGGGGGAGAGGAGGQMTAASGVLLQPTAVLELISLLAESPTLGCRAHAPGTSDVLRHMGFGLDVKKVVATVLAAEDQRWGVRPGQEGKEELSEGWDLLDVET